MTSEAVLATDETPAPLPQDFAGKVALITGATRGIGYGIAAELIARGAKVTITARKPDELEEAVASLGGGAVALGVRGSADDEAHQADAVARTVETFGALDVLVNNAAINPQFGMLVDADLDAVRRIMNVNVVAPLGWLQQAHRAWLGEHGGTVLNVASVGGVRAGAPIGAYNASKAGLIHLTAQLSAELAPGIRINAIAPAVVKTKFARALYEADEAGAAAMYPMKRLGVTDDTAKLAAFLLGPDSGWITGETVVLDGGIRQAMGR